MYKEDNQIDQAGLDSYIKKKEAGYLAHTQHYSTWISKLSIKPDSLHLGEEKVGKMLELIGTGKNFLNRILIMQALISIMSRWNFIKL